MGNRCDEDMLLCFSISIFFFCLPLRVSITQFRGACLCSECLNSIHVMSEKIMFSMPHHELLVTFQSLTRCRLSETSSEDPQRLHGLFLGSVQKGVHCIIVIAVFNHRSLRSGIMLPQQLCIISNVLKWLFCFVLFCSFWGSLPSNWSSQVQNSMYHWLNEKVNICLMLWRMPDGLMPDNEKMTGGTQTLTHRPKLNRHAGKRNQVKFNIESSRTCKRAPASPVMSRYYAQLVLRYLCSKGRKRGQVFPGKDLAWSQWSLCFIFVKSTHSMQLFFNWIFILPEEKQESYDQQDSCHGKSLLTNSGHLWAVI